MKTLLILASLFLFACTVEARPYQAIIDDLRSEVRKGDTKAVELQKKVDGLHEWGVDQWKERQEVEARNAKLEKKARVVFVWGFGIGVVLTLVGVAIILARRSSVVVVPTAQQSPEPDRSIPVKTRSRPRTKPAAKKAR